MTVRPGILTELAPTELPNLRKDRYDGGGFGVSIRRFAPADIRTISQIYEILKGIYDIWLYTGQGERDRLDLRLYEKYLSRIGASNFLVAVQSVGESTYGDDRSEAAMELRRVVHDIRGGAMAGLVGYAGLLEIEPGNREALRSAVFLARDHAKMMRNALHDLDEPVRAADELERVHGIDSFVDKWNRTTIRLGLREIRIGVDSTFQGSVSNRCLETSAIDRILYNLINNACRFAASNEVQLSILPVGDDLVRWVVGNETTSDQRAWLHKTVGDDLGALYEGGLTRGGSGIGLSTCAAFVSRSFGLTDVTQSFRQGYLGARLVDNQFLSWFHWPVHHPGPEDNRCDCRD